MKMLVVVNKYVRFDITMRTADCLPSSKMSARPPVRFEMSRDSPTKPHTGITSHQHSPLGQLLQGEEHLVFEFVYMMDDLPTTALPTGCGRWVCRTKRPRC